MKIIGVVPIKMNSERLLNKNILSFTNGKPLINYILETLKKVEKIDNIYVYCSDHRISNFIPEDIIYLERSKNLDKSETKINEVLKSFAKDVDADIYVLAHATAPFIKYKSIEEGLFNVLNNGYDSSFSVHKLQEFLWKTGKPFNYDMTNISRTQDLDTIYKETSGFYIYKKETILKYNRRIGIKPYLVEVSRIESIDIDEREDFNIANAIFNNILRKETK